MPSVQRIRWAKFRSLLTVGVALSILLVLIFLLLGGETFRRKSTIVTFVTDAGGIVAGAPVRLNGIPIGEVHSVELSAPERRIQDRVVEIRMRVLTAALEQMPADSIVEIGAANILGEAVIEITKGRAVEPLRPGGELEYQPPREIDRAQAIKSLEANLRRMDQLLDDIEAGRGSLGRFLRDDSLYRQVTARLAQLEKSVAQTSRTGELGRMIHEDALYKSLQANLLRHDQLLAGLESGEGRAGQFLRDPQMYQGWLQQVRRLRAEISSIQRGEGRLGRFVMSDEEYTQWNRRVERLMLSVDSLTSGEGPLGQLFVSAQLYESLAGSTRELQESMRDFRDSPTRFMRLRLF
jgi:phospholipid/cholesterol/gamma-HCH transport system substrate-binding protein